MWTLRDLLMWLNPDYADRMRQQKAKKMSRGYMDDDFTLQNLLYNKQSKINDSGALHESAFRPPNLQQYYMGMEEGYERHKNPPKYQGML